MNHAIAQLRTDLERTPANVAAHIAGFRSWDATPKMNQQRIALIARDNVVLIFGLAICKAQHTGWLSARTQVWKRIDPWTCIHTEIPELKTLADVLANHPEAIAPDRFLPQVEPPATPT